MGRQQRTERAAMGGDPYKTAIIRLMREFSHSHDRYAVFSDFVEVSAIAISGRVDKAQFDVREKRYLEIVAKYTREELDRFAAMFAQLHLCYQSRVDALGDPGPAAVMDQGLGDVLGEIFMALELGNAHNGQFFTPYSVSQLMAMLTIGDGASVRERGFITLQEPACGSAGMVVATAQAIHQAGLNYPEALHATCVDIDRRCVHMAYVQLSLLGIAATVVHGNALSLEVHDVWYTPAHVLVGWSYRLRRRRAEAPAASEAAAPRGQSEDAPAQDSAVPASMVANAPHPTDSGVSHLPVTGSQRQADAACEPEEGEVGVIERDECESHSQAPAVSIAALFEEIAQVGQSASREAVTIFDRIDQMTLF